MATGMVKFDFYVASISKIDIYSIGGGYRH